MNSYDSIFSEGDDLAKNEIVKLKRAKLNLTLLLF